MALGRMSRVAAGRLPSSAAARLSEGRQPLYPAWRGSRAVRNGLLAAVPLLVFGLLLSQWLGAHLVPPRPRLSADAAIERVQDTRVGRTPPRRGPSRRIDDLISRRTGVPAAHIPWDARFDGRGWLVTCRSGRVQELRFAWWVPDDGPGVFTVNDYAALLAPDLPRLGASPPGPGPPSPGP
jgi:hypothetical protein